jgi:carbon-monoxide dehydrogenase large subunit
MNESEEKSSWVGKHYGRREDNRLITGKGAYLADIATPDALIVKFHRSNRAHAKIRSIDVSAARNMEGVIAVLTGEDIKDEIKPFPIPAVKPLLEANYPTYWPLAVDRVKYHGEPVAAVIAVDKYIAEDAIEAIVVDYESLPALVDPEAALEPGAPVLHDGWDNNIMFQAVLTGGFTEDEQKANSVKVDEAMKSADVIVKKRFRTHRCGCTPMETRGAIISWSSNDGLHCWLSTQRPHIDRLVFSDLFNIPHDRVTVRAPRDQGGAFGVKAPIYREPIIVAYAALKYGKTVRWIETREEHLMSVSQERDQIHDLELGATKDGKIIALRDNIIADNGDGCEGVFWGFVMPFYGAALMPNGYDIPACDIKLTCVTTNKPALSPARAFGSLPGRFALARAIDMLAYELGMEPAELRRKNLITDLPTNVATGVHYDKGDFVKVWDTLLEHVDLPAFRKEQERAHAQGRNIGIGFSIGVHASGVASEALVPMEGQPGYGSATVKIGPRGSVEVYEGDAPQGQGHETTMAQVAAETLGIHPDQVTVHVGNTSNTPFASGTFGARGGSYTASAVAMACKSLKEKIAKVFIHDNDLDLTAEEIEFRDGQVISPSSGNIRTTLAEMAERIIMKPIDLPAGVVAGLDETAFFEAAEPMMSFSTHAAIVEVDENSGEFKILRYITCEDVGRVINPQIVEGQVHGGVIQGLSNSMFEEFLYDENGQQLSSTFENYKVAKAADVPNIEVLHANTPCEHTPLGTRGLGEGTPGAVPGALCNAICDAIKHRNVQITELPIRPDRLWALMQAS